MIGRMIFRRNLRQRVLPGLLAALLLPCAAVACAQSSGAEKQGQTEQPDAALRVTDLTVGLAGQLKVGYWAPFTIEVSAGNEPALGRVELVMPDNDGVPTRVVSDDVSLAAGQTRQVTLYSRLGQLTGDVTVHFRGEAGTVASRTFRSGSPALSGVRPSTSPLILSLGLNGAQKSAAGANPASLVPVAHVGDLPAEWYGLESVGALVINAGQSDFAEQLHAAPAQVAALEHWVHLGGRLVLCVGAEAPQLLGTDGPLAALAPGEFDAVVPLRQGTVLETYAATTEPLSPAEPLNLNVARLRDVRGQIEAYAGSGPRDLPLVVRTPRGFGEVVFVAVDLDQPALADWAGRSQLLNKLLDLRRPAATDETTGTLGAVTTLGFVDLAGQLRGALDQFEGVRLVPFWLVAVLITVYILAIGPLDYYVVRHLLKRPAATWVTFAIAVVVFSAGAAALAFGLKGRELRINQLDIVDFDAESGLVRGTTWANLFSPRIETYDLTLELRQPVDSRAAGNAPLEPGRLFSWFGLTGTGFGGMDTAGGAAGGIGAASANLPLFSVGYEYGPHLASLDQVPIAVWSSKALAGRWWGAAASGFEAQLADDGRLVGTLKSNLDVPLTRCVLIFDKWAYVIRDFQPGREIDLQFDIDPQTVDTYLRKVTARGDRQVAPPYDQESFDVPRIVEVMTAHELAGGRAYTGLANEYQPYVELSELVARDRAVLVGRVDRPATELMRDGEPLDAEGAEVKRWTFYRVVLPVDVK